jgi:N-acetylglucosamine malate deacetylase 1
MRLDFSSERILAVVAHPDNAEMLCAGTLARARTDGATVAVGVLCRGDKGQPTPPLRDLTEIRRAEMEDAAALLGAAVYFGGFADGELFDGAPARRKVVEMLREFRPTLLLAHAPEDYHPDYRAASAVAEAASWYCASRGYETAVPPVQVPPALWWMDTINPADFAPGFFIDVTEHLELKRRMLACHQSQLRRGADHGPVPLDELMRQQCRSRGAQAGVYAAEAFRIHRAWKRTMAW